MCFGAMQQAHLPGVVFGAANMREGALGGVANLNHLPWKRSLEVTAGVRAAEAAALLTDFFTRRRSRPQP